MRLAEEEYLLHRTRENADQVIFWYHELFGRIEDNKSIPRAEKSKIEALLDTYDTEFEAVVRLDHEIREIQAKIKPL